MKVVCKTCGVEYDRQAGSVRSVQARNNGVYRCIKCATAARVRNKGTPVHNSYSGARQRCLYPKHKAYANYGGRGIQFLWESFADFLADMGDSYFEGATLERVDVDGHYCKANCRWATRTEQARNTRKNIHTEESVREIRRLHAAGVSQVALAERFGDSQGNISNIVLMKVWS